MDRDPDAVISTPGAPDTDLDRPGSASEPFVGRWNRLVSNTNWEKGRIIAEWREASRASGISAQEYSDEAWSARVGGVSGQHVGRLRRVFERFGGSCADYPGLYWSHFCSAMDWNDAEMWLEGAVQNRWSVSRMRHARSETLGEVDQDPPRDQDIVTSEWDEDGVATDDAHDTEVPSSVAEFRGGPLDEGPDFGDEQEPASGRQSIDTHDAASSEAVADDRAEFVRPFAGLAELPEDLSEAFETLKLAILHHKLENWERISASDVLASLEALKQLVVAP